MDETKARAGWLATGEGMGWIKDGVLVLPPSPALPVVVPDDGDEEAARAEVARLQKALRNQKDAKAREDAAGQTVAHRDQTIAKVEGELQAALATLAALTGEAVDVPVPGVVPPTPAPAPLAGPAPRIVGGATHVLHPRVVVGAGSHEVTATPVGGGTAVVHKSALPDFEIKLPASGVYDITARTIGADGTLGPASASARFFAVVVGRGGVHGLNASGVRIMRGSDTAPVAIEATADTVLFEPLPKAVKVDGLWINGIMKNPWADATGTPGRGPHAWDQRLRADVKSGVAPQMASERFSEALLEKAWPQTVVLGDIFSKVVSKLDPDTGSQGHRQGMVEHHIGIVVLDKLPAANVFAPNLMRAGTISNAPIAVPKAREMLDRLVAMQHAAPVDVSRATIEEMIARGSRFDASYTLMRGGMHSKDSPEPYTPYRTARGFEDGAYYRFAFYSYLSALLISDKATPDQKARLLDILLMFATQADYPGNPPNWGAGIGQHHEFPVMMLRHAQVRSFDDLPDQKGNYLGMYFYWTEGDLAKIRPHDNLNWPGFSRRRKVTKASTTAKDGSTRFDVEWVRKYQTGIGSVGDELKQRFYGMTVVREKTGERRPWDDRLGGDASGTTRPFGTSQPFSSPVQAGEIVYLEIPEGKRPYAGLPDWNYGCGQWASYNPVPAMSYRSVNQPAGFILLAQALGLYPTDKAGPLRGLIACKDYYIRTALPDDAKGYGWLPQYPGPHVQGDSFVAELWAANAKALGLTA